MNILVRLSVYNRTQLATTTVVTVPRGVASTALIETPFLLSAGQAVQVVVEAEPVYEKDDRRSLYDILADAVQHGREKPDHGGNCVCMDKFIREIKGQITDALPDSSREADWERRHDARWRIHHLLNVAARYL
jgi:hypothetical protein